MTPPRDALEEMIVTQRVFQERVDRRYRSDDIEDRIAYIRDTYVALVKEAGEALDETSWKPWTTGGRFIHHAELLTELTDIWCFLCNMWLAAMPTATPEEVATAMLITYRTKMEVNHRRQDEGYDGTNKCPVCRRALDDAHVGFTAPELICDGTVAGCRMPDLA